MQSNRRESSVELEIQSLLILHGSLDRAVSELLKKYETVPLTLEQSELVATFCLHAGRPAQLVQFLSKQISIVTEFPWGHFAEALGLALDHLDSKVAKTVIQGAGEQDMLWHLARSRILDVEHTSLQQEHDLRKRSQQEKVLALKRDLLMQAETLRSQDMDEQEGQVLERVLRMFPKDAQIQTLHQEHRARKALRLLDQKTSSPPERDVENLQPEIDHESREILDAIASSMRIFWEEGKSDPRLGADFAIAHAMWDNWETCLDFLPADSELPYLWLRAEVLLQTRRFVLLIHELIEIEKLGSEDPDVTFAASYLRAQALWGIGRKFEAIEVMEGIVNVKPSYRAAASLLAIWKDPSR